MGTPIGRRSQLRAGIDSASLRKLLMISRSRVAEIFTSRSGCHDLRKNSAQGFRSGKEGGRPGSGALFLRTSFRRLSVAVACIRCFAGRPAKRSDDRTVGWLIVVPSIRRVKALPKVSCCCCCCRCSGRGQRCCHLSTVCLAGMYAVLAVACRSGNSASEPARTRKEEKELYVVVVVVVVGGHGGGLLVSG